MNIVLRFLCVICFSLATSVLATEPGNNCDGCDWLAGRSVDQLFAGDYNTPSGQGQVVVSTTTHSDGFKYLLYIPLNVEWGQIAYSMALTAKLKSKKIDCLGYCTYTDQSNKLKYYTAYRIVFHD
jgi:hypothetical protein